LALQAASQKKFSIHAALLLLLFKDTTFRKALLFLKKQQKSNDESPLLFSRMPRVARLEFFLQCCFCFKTALRLVVS